MMPDVRTMVHEHLLMHFTRNGAYGPSGADLLILERGEGPYVFDLEGRRYIDALSSLFCAQLGYSYGAEFGEVACRQLERLAFNTNWATAHPPAAELAAAIIQRTPGDLTKIFFTSGGSEAVEAAWKIARQFHVANGEPQRDKAISRRWAYHGASLGALSFTAVQSMREPFGRPAIDVAHVSNTNRFRQADSDSEDAFCRRLLHDVENTILAEGAERIGMIIAEPIQNAGGCLVPPEGYWAGLREISDRYGIILVADEVITGFGRLGEWFGSTALGAAPDMITIAKGLTAAQAPMGAVVVAEHLAEPLYAESRTLLHGVTFGGHPLSACIALKTIEIFERDRVLENVRALEQGLRERLEDLRQLPIVGDVRGAGFFWAIEMVKDEANARFDAPERERLLRNFLPKRLLKAGIIARADDRGDAVLQIAPPLICDDAQLGEIVDGLGDVLEDAGRYMNVPGGIAG